LLDFYRFVLAVCVVQAHVPWGSASGPLSQHAVFSFYVLSGFLMTLILNHTYGFGPVNFARFWANRFLRLYPAYATVIAITVLHILLVGPLTQLHGLIVLPDNLPDWLANLSMFGIAGFTAAQISTAILIPNAWSLSVELFCYLLLSIYFARSRQRALAMLVGGIVITGAELVRVAVQAPPYYDFQNHYGVLQAGIIPFAAGSLAYFYRGSPWLRFSRAGILGLLVLWAANCILAHVFEFHRYVSSLYVAAVINAVLVPMMFSFDAAHPKHPWTRALGGIAYPIFVSHILIGTLVFHYFGFSRGGIDLLTVTLVATIGFSLAVHFGIERRIESLRAVIKQRQWQSWSIPWRRSQGMPAGVPAALTAGAAGTVGQTTDAR